MGDATDIMDSDSIVSTDVQDTMGQLLMDVEDLDGLTQGITCLTDSPTTPIETEDIKMEKEEGGSKPKQPGPPDPKDEPIVIDLSDDEDEFSKENIEKAPVKSLHGLIKCLTADQSAELLTKIKLAVSNLSRDVLEEMYCTKLQENMEMEASLRKLEAKVVSFVLYRDRVTFKAQCLQGQLTDSARAMVTVTDQLTRNPKNGLNACNPTPLKFQRTVGIQCRNDPLPRLKGAPLSNSKVLNTPPPPLATANGKKSISSGIPGSAKNSIGQITVPSNIGTKRTKPQTISVDDIRNQVQTETPAKMARRPGPASAIRGAPQLQNGGTNVVISNGNINMAPNTSKTFVDLASAATQQQKGNVVNQNGVQYRVVNSPGMQIVSAPNGGSFQLVSTGQPQGRQVLLQQQTAVRNVNTSQQIVIPNQQNVIQKQLPNRMGQNRTVVAVANNPTTRPLAPRTAGSALNNLSVLMKTQGTPANGMINSLAMFVLPILPPMSAQPKKPKDPPPRPTLTLQEQGGGIVLSWTHHTSSAYAEIQSYQIFACQEPIVNLGITPQWKRVGDVKALPLPMACTLSQFTEENRYHFIVRGVDVYNRTGVFCEVVNILLRKRR